MECSGEIMTFEKESRSLKTGKLSLFEMGSLIRSLSNSNEGETMSSSIVRHIRNAYMNELSEIMDRGNLKIKDEENDKNI